MTNEQVSRYSSAKEIKNVLFRCGIDADHVRIKRRIRATDILINNQYRINQIYIKRNILEAAGFKLFFMGCTTTMMF